MLPGTPAACVRKRGPGTTWYQLHVADCPRPTKHAACQHVLHVVPCGACWFLPPFLPSRPPCPSLWPKPYTLTTPTLRCSTTRVPRAILSGPSSSLMLYWWLPTVLVHTHWASSSCDLVYTVTRSATYSRRGTATQARMHAARRSAVKTGWVGPRLSTCYGCECHSCTHLPASLSTWCTLCTIYTPSHTPCTQNPLPCHCRHVPTPARKPL